MPAGPQQPVRLGDPHVRVAPDRRAVLRDREVERAVGVRDRLGVAVDERQRDTVLGGEAAGGRQLARRVVDADHAGAASRHPRRDVRRPAPELDRVQTSQVVGEKPWEFDAPHPPRRLGAPVALAAGDPVRCVFVPLGTVDGHMVWDVIWKRPLGHQSTATAPAAAIDRDERPTRTRYAPGGVIHAPSIQRRNDRGGTSMSTRSVSPGSRRTRRNAARLAERARRVVVRRFDVHLHDLAAGPSTGVRDVDGDGNRSARITADADRLDGERRVPEPEAEREQRIDVVAVVPAVPDQQALAVDRPAARSRVVPRRGGLGEITGERDRQPPPRLGVTGEHVGQRITHRLPREPQLEHGRHLAEPRHRDG